VPNYKYDFDASNNLEFFIEVTDEGETFRVPITLEDAARNSPTLLDRLVDDLGDRLRDLQRDLQFFRIAPQSERWKRIQDLDLSDPGTLREAHEARREVGALIKNSTQVAEALGVLSSLLGLGRPSQGQWDIPVAPPPQDVDSDPHDDNTTEPEE
jgi:hypothetical protein